MYFDLGKKYFQHEEFGWGLYEGQCDQKGNVSGVGRWVCIDKESGVSSKD